MSDYISIPLKVLNLIFQAFQETKDTKKTKEAILELDEFIKNHPNCGEAYIYKALMLYMLEQCQEAVDTIDQYLSEFDAKDIQAWNHKGRILNEMNLHEESRLAFQKAIEIDQDNIESLIGLIRSLIGLERFEESLLYLRSGLSIEPLSVDFWTLNSWVQLNYLSDYHQSLVSIENAIENKLRIPKEVVRVFNESDAIDKLNKLRESDVAGYSLDYLYVFRAQIYIHLSRWDKAIESLELASDCNPDNFDAWFLQGFCLEKLESQEKALEKYEIALEIDKNSYKAWHRKGLCLISLKRYQEATQCFKKLTEVEPSISEGWYLYAGINDALNLSEDTTKYHIEATRLDPKSFQAWYLLGDHYKKLSLKYKDSDLGSYKDFAQKAINSFENALAINPRHESTLLSSASLLSSLKFYKKSALVFDKLVSFYADKDDYWYFCGLDAAESENFPRAKFCIEKSIEINSGCAEYYLSYAFVLEKMSFNAEIINSYLQKAKTINPDL
jgi:tetratricopeptide (TPR) repeat protein